MILLKKPFFTATTPNIRVLVIKSSFITRFFKRFFLFYVMFLAVFPIIAVVYALIETLVGDYWAATILKLFVSDPSILLSAKMLSFWKILFLLPFFPATLSALIITIAGSDTPDKS